MAPRTIALSPLGSGALTVTASGGPVDWSINESPGLIGQLSVSPSSGHLLAGQSATVSVRVSATAGALAARAGVTLTSETGVCGNCTLTVNPGNLTVTVLIEVNASPSPSKPSCPPSSSPPPSSPPPDSSRPEAVTGGGCRG